MRTYPDYYNKNHLGETYNHRASDKRQTNLWIVMVIVGMILLGVGSWIIDVMLEIYK